MTNYKEEQELEIEALQSIFTEGKEFERISDTEFKLHLVPDPSGEEENHVKATLHIVYTDDYPDSPPDWKLEDVDSLGDTKQEDLRAKVTEVVESSMGMAMVYSMAEACQDYLKENNVKALSMHEEMMQRLGQQEGDAAAEGEGEEDAEDDDFDNGPDPEEEWKGLAEKALCPEEDRITLESFMEWKNKFEAEMIASGVLKREEAKAKSGKQIFLETQSQQTGNNTAADGKSPDAGSGAGGAPLVYDAALFGEEGEDDLDDLSGED
mmetsp:Transcript_6310/g.15719  ORF Transcript_6310/g.15719 Transcript_6310/m.15719 type:complete len:266 (-) Transcript_6310:111-908(-)